ncbi:MAG: N-acyl homoserine lactonase family protein [Pararhodobacter sp.]|nr:N-acyl homoserine lactonase family protein [Pararhodobacter sp.]
MPPPKDQPAIHAVRLGTTGRGSMHPEHRYGSRLPQLVWLLFSRRWVHDVPVHFFAIEHREGLVLFDTGLDPEIGVDPRGYLGSAIGEFFLRRLFRWKLGPEDALVPQLARMGHKPEAVRLVVFSHLHFDHTGCIAQVLHAPLMAPRSEWDVLSQPHPERQWYLRQHLDIPGAQWSLFDLKPCTDPALAPFGQCHDVMGDGSITLLPTPGHTAGSVSMLLRSAGMPPLLLVADLCFEEEMLMQDRLPGVAEDNDALLESYAKVRALREALPGLVILPSHDMGTAARLAQAMGGQDKPG